MTHTRTTSTLHPPGTSLPQDEENNIALKTQDPIPYSTMKDSMTPLEEIRHSCAHVMAAAVLRLHPSAKLDIGPPTDQGFYYDFDLDHAFTPTDLEAIEAEMQKIIKENQKFERIEVTRQEAEAFFKESGQSYKLERLADIPEGDPITYYRNGDFTDLCAGTHVRYTKKIKAFKLLSIAGAYYRGDEKNKQMQRIYGTAFPTKDELATYLQQLEEAKARDHRKLGKELQLFHIDPTVGQGLILWTPRGAQIRESLQSFISEELKRQDYTSVVTPHIGKLELYKTSGHFPYYQESQFPPVIDRDFLSGLAEEGCSCSELSSKMTDGEIEGYMLKPMNCPMHIKIFDSQPRSYRDLPVRLSEFGTVYRWEQSGELNGMTRVRGFTQDDAHIFCTEDQVSAEINGCLELVKIIFKTLGMEDYRVRIGLRDVDSDKYTGTAEQWNRAEAALKEAASKLDVPYTEEPGEAAFYGPKIDFVVRDVIGREWQLGTVQVDYQLPKRFGLSYVGSDNQDHTPVVIHRAPFGSLERFCGVLIEHFGGNFPTWLAPEQVRVLPLNDDLIPHAEDLKNQLKSAGIRATVDDHSEKLGAKIRKGENMKLPYMLVVGNKEKEAGAVSIRSRVNKPLDGETRAFSDFLEHIQNEVKNRALPVG